MTLFEARILQDSVSAACSRDAGTVGTAHCGSRTVMFRFAVRYFRTRRDTSCYQDYKEIWLFTEIWKEKGVKWNAGAGAGAPAEDFCLQMAKKEFKEFSFDEFCVHYNTDVFGVSAFSTSLQWPHRITNAKSIIHIVDECCQQIWIVFSDVVPRVVPAVWFIPVIAFSNTCINERPKWASFTFDQLPPQPIEGMSAYSLFVARLRAWNCLWKRCSSDPQSALLQKDELSDLGFIFMDSYNCMKSLFYVTADTSSPDC